MKKNNLYDFLIILFIQIGLSAIPFAKFIPNETIVLILQIIIQALAFTGYLIFIFKKSQLDIHQEKINLKYVLVLFPTLVVCFSNYFFLSFACEYTFNFDFNMIFKIILASEIAMNEEFIFRLILINNLEKTSNFMKIIFSAGLFGLCHITVFLSTWNFADLIIIVYTFVLGLLLAISYLLTKSFYPGVVIHFFFNTFNEVLFKGFIFKNMEYGKWIGINALVGSIVAIYILVVLLIDKNLLKKDNYIYR